MLFSSEMFILCTLCEYVTYERNVIFFQAEDYTESEFRILCDHLGHSYDVHKRYYRLPMASIELAKVSQMLLRSEEK